jgi:putative MATE family efflux protein
LSHDTTAATPAAEPPRFWATVREALGGAHGRDFTEGPIGRALLLLAVPMVLEMALESVFAVVNVFWVNRLGSDAVAAVGLTESMFSTIYALALGLAIGATAVVARRIGEKDPDGAARAAVQSIALGILVAAPIAVLGGVFAPDLLRLMGASENVVTTGSGYTRVLFAGNFVILLLFLINAIFRGAGDAAIAMRCLWLANFANLVLDPFLIFGWGPFPELGVQGAAVATTIGRGIGVLYQFYRLAGRDRRFVIERRHLRLEPAVLANLLRLSGTGMLQILIATTSWIGLFRVVASFGSATIAGYTISVRVIMFAFLPSWGLSNAAATMVGQALGAGKPERAERAAWKAARYNLLFQGALGTSFLLLAGPIVALFTSDPEAARTGSEALRLVSAGFLFYAFGMVLSQALNGAGDAWTPALLNLFCFWVLEVPLAWFLAHPLGWGARGAFVAVAVAFTALGVTSTLVFRRGRWKTRVV